MTVTSKAQQIGEKIASGEWAQGKRKAGAAITVISKNGGYFHADPEFAQVIGRAKLAANGFDMIPPQFAAEGAAMLAKHGMAPARAWFPYLSDDRRLVWCRIESYWEDGVMAAATWREEDPSKHVLNTELID